LSTPGQCDDGSVFKLRVGSWRNPTLLPIQIIIKNRQANGADLHSASRSIGAAVKPFLTKKRPGHALNRPVQSARPSLTRDVKKLGRLEAPIAAELTRLGSACTDGKIMPMLSQGVSSNLPTEILFVAVIVMVSQ